MVARHLSRRDFLRLGGLAAAGAAIAGCAGQAAPTAPPVPTVAGVKELAGEINFHFWGNVEEMRRLRSENLPWQSTFLLTEQWAAAHPKVKVNYISEPEDGIYQRYRTALAEDQLDGLVAVYALDDVVKGLQDKWYNLHDMMATPNPYGKLATWKDEFWKDPIAISDWHNPRNMTDKQVFFLGNTTKQGLVSDVIYYNIDMWEKAGLTDADIPKTWADWMRVSQKIKDAGMSPIFRDWNHFTRDWGHVLVIEQVMDSFYDVMLKAFGVARGYFVARPEHMAWAYKNKLFRGDMPQYLDGARIHKEWSQYYNPDWAAAEPGVDYLLAGRVVMQHQGIWQLGQYRDAGFRMGSFAPPLITKETSQYAVRKGEPRWGNLEGVTAQNSIGIPATTAKDPNKLAIAIDLLQYLTARQSNEQLCQMIYPPCLEPGQDIKEVVTDPVEQKLLHGFFQHPLSIANIIIGYGGSIADVTPFLLQYMQGEITLEQFGQEHEKACAFAYEQLLANNRDWDVSKWPPAP